MGDELRRRLAAAGHTMTIAQVNNMDKCAVCGEGPSPHNYMHAFTTTPNDLRDKPEPAASRPPTTILSTDIALRLALINKGVLTTDDLRAAEVQLGLRPDMAVVGQHSEAAPGPHDVG